MITTSCDPAGIVKVGQIWRYDRDYRVVSITKENGIVWAEFGRGLGCCPVSHISSKWTKVRDVEAT